MIHAEWNADLELDSLQDAAEHDIDSYDRAARSAAVNARLQDCQKELDALGMFEAGTYISMSLHFIERSTTQYLDNFSLGRRGY